MLFSEKFKTTEKNFHQLYTWEGRRMQRMIASIMDIIFFL